MGGILKVKKLKIEEGTKVVVPPGYNPFKYVPNTAVALAKKKTLAEQILEEQKEKFDKRFGGER